MPLLLSPLRVLARRSFDPRTVFVAVLAAIAFTATTVVLYSSATLAADPPVASGPGPRPALTVTTAVPERTAVPLRLAANGNVAAWQEAVIGAQTNGLRLQEVRVNVGDQVKAGQVLATFSAEPVQADVAQVRAALQEAQANAAEAAANAARARSLQATGALSQQQIEQFTTAEKTAQARVDAARATLNVQQLRLRDTRLLAPDSGVISARMATVGAVVGAGTELFRMVRKGRLEWRAEVTSSELRRIAPGGKVSVMSASGVTVEGTVRVIAPTVDPQTRNALVYVDLPTNSDFRAGMFARGEFALGSSEALTVPQESLVSRDGFAYVFVVGADQRVQQRKVHTGRRVADRVEVLSGLTVGAAVVVRGAGLLSDGDLVRVVAQPTPVTGTPHHNIKSNVPVALMQQASAAIK